MSDVILKTQSLTKEFKGFTAVSNVDLAVRRGSIHALIGPNGAGKTTCFNLLTKFLVPTSGSIQFNGHDITAEAPAQIARRGVIRSFQISAVFPHLTLIENVRLGLQRKLGTSFHFWRSERSLRQLDDRAMQLLTEVGLDDLADEVTVNLPYGRKRALEHRHHAGDGARADAAGPAHPRHGARRRGPRHAADQKSVCRTHHPDGGAQHEVVSTIADCITVLQRGAVLAEGPYAEVSSNPQVMEAYMGTTDGQLQGAH